MSQYNSNSGTISLILIIIFIAVQIGVVAYFDSKIEEVREQTLSRADVMMFDSDKAMNELIKNGASATDALLYTNTMMKVLKAKGVLVIDAKAVLAVPESAKIDLIGEKELYQVARQLGLEPTDAERNDIKKLLDRTEKQLNMIN